MRLQALIGGGIAWWVCAVAFLGGWIFPRQTCADVTPIWWERRGVLQIGALPNDYAPLNLGQLKHMAAMASEELDAVFPEGAGEDVGNLISGWSAPQKQANDFAVANIGQLKWVAQRFHDRLQKMGFTWGQWEYPIKLELTPNDYAPANVGQLKAMFAFDLTVDEDGDGLPDWWETQAFSQKTLIGNQMVGSPGGWEIYDDQDDPDEDGVPNGEEYHQRSDPLDYYQGKRPRLRMLGGDHQVEPEGNAFGNPLFVQVLNEGGIPLVNAPIRFYVSSGDISLADYQTWGDVVPVARTDERGIVSVATHFGPAPGKVNVTPVGRFPVGADPDGAVGEVDGYPEGWTLNFTYEGRVYFGAVELQDGLAQGEAEEVVKEISVQILSTLGKPLAKQWVHFEVLRGDARWEDESYGASETDAWGIARMRILPGYHQSEVEVRLGSQRVRLWIDSKTLPVVSVVGSSLDGVEAAFPADGALIFYLSDPLPEAVGVEELIAGTGARKASGGGIAGKLLNVSFRRQRMYAAGAGTVRSDWENVLVPGGWEILAGRKAIRFVPENALWRYCHPGPGAGGTSGGVQEQVTVSFLVALNPGNESGSLIAPYSNAFCLKDTEAFKATLATAESEKVAAQIRSEREIDSFVCVGALRITACLPEPNSCFVGIHSPILIQWNEALDPMSFPESGFLLEEENGESILCQYEILWDRRILMLSPQKALRPSTLYRVRGIEELKSFYQFGVAAEGVYQFWTGAAGVKGGEENGESGVASYTIARGLVRVDDVLVFQIREPELQKKVHEVTVRVSLIDKNGNEESVVPSVYSVSPFKGKVSITPSERLQPGRRYCVSLGFPAGDGAQEPGGVSGTGNGALVWRKALYSTESQAMEGLLSAWLDSEWGRGKEVPDFGVGGAFFGGNGPGVLGAGWGAASGASGSGSGTGSAEGFRFPFGCFCIPRYKGYTQGTDLEFETTALDGRVSVQRYAAGPAEGNWEWPTVWSPTVPFGGVIRVRAVPTAEAEQGAIPAGMAPPIVFGRPAPQSAALKSFQRPQSNCFYVSFDKAVVAPGAPWAADTVDGLDPLYDPGRPGRTLHQKGAVPFGSSGLEVWWCPVVVRNEGESAERSQDEVILSTRSGVARYAPVKGDQGVSELPGLYAKRLERYFALPYPRQCIAWINWYGGNGADAEAGLFGDPAMPRLTAVIRDAPPEVQGCWRLRVQYDRGNGRGERDPNHLRRLHPRTQPEDIVDIPGRPEPDLFPSDVGSALAVEMPERFSPELLKRVQGNTPSYSETMPANQVWRIFETPEWKAEIRSRGVFGGEATLYWCPVEDEVGKMQRGREWLVARFRIGGRNPPNAGSRAWLQGSGSGDQENVPEAGPSGKLWYAYAIAKHETSEYRYVDSERGAGVPSWYNQFRANPSRADLGYPTWNNDGADKPGGYGIFQVTGNIQDEKANIPRRQIWNWQENLRGGGRILLGKWIAANRALARYRDEAGGRPIPPLWVRGVGFSEGSIRSMLDPLTMKRYNGCSRANPADKIDLGEDGSGYYQGFPTTNPEVGDYCYHSRTRARWCLSRFNGFVEIQERPDKSRIRIYRGFDYVDRVCGEVEVDGPGGAGLVGR